MSEVKENSELALNFEPSSEFLSLDNTIIRPVIKEFNDNGINVTER